MIDISYHERLNNIKYYPKKKKIIFDNLFESVIFLLLYRLFQIVKYIIVGE